MRDAAKGAQWVDNGDGTSTGSFKLPTLHAELWAKALDDLTSPRKLGEARIDPEAEGVPGCTDRSPTANAYHGTCMGCHRTASREEGVEAPIRCNGCHAVDMQ